MARDICHSAESDCSQGEFIRGKYFRAFLPDIYGTLLFEEGKRNACICCLNDMYVPFLPPVLHSPGSILSALFIFRVGGKDKFHPHKAEGLERLTKLQ